MARCDALGLISDEPEGLTRTFLSPAMRRANELVGEWMRDAGLQVREDAVFNLIGRWPGTRKGAPVLILGSHLDTVRDAGKYDGPLGVFIALAAVENLRMNGVSLPFPVDVIGFCDEEGVRYQSTYLGSRALAGTLGARDLKLRDAGGIALRDSGIGDIRAARRRRAATLGYVEVHMEQGPVLEAQKLPLGVVTAIAGQTRAEVVFVGRAAHAGTTPMHLRKDALAAAAGFITAVEKRARGGLVATVGRLSVLPGASNVIPGSASLTLDIRHQRDAARTAAVRDLRDRAMRLAHNRGLRCEWRVVQETGTVKCDDLLTRVLRNSSLQVQGGILLLPSGAGHDAAAMARLCPVGMLFVRCKGGVSHHPDESVKTGDVAVAIASLTRFLLNMKALHE